MADGIVDVINDNGELVCVKSILALDDSRLAAKLERRRREMAAKVPGTVRRYG